MVVEQFKSLLLPVRVDFVTGPKISANHCSMPHSIRMTAMQIGKIEHS